MAEPVSHGDAVVIPIRRKAMSAPDIVAGLIAGDPAAGEALVHQFGPKIDRRVWRLLGGDSEHGDIVQQVFGRILKSISSLKDPVALEAWIGQLTVSVIKGELRRRKVRRIVGLSSTTVDDESVDAEQPRKMQLKRAFVILERMAPDERIVFVLRFIEGLSIPETAAAVGISPATVKRRITKARETFLKKAGRDPFLSPLVNEEEGA